jgi:hypothetical protein
MDPIAMTVNPYELGFVPRSDWWPPRLITLGRLRELYFTRRSGDGRKFLFKLYHALLITNEHASAYSYVGAKWINGKVMKINAQSFGHLLGIAASQPGFFHSQGYFPKNGFVQVQKESDVATSLPGDIADVDDLNVRLFTDEHGRFVKDIPLTEALKSNITQGKAPSRPDDDLLCFVRAI